MVTLSNDFILSVGEAVTSPVTASGGQGDPGIQLANALAACILSTRLPHSHRQWAATQLVSYGQTGGFRVVSICLSEAIVMCKVSVTFIMKVA